jgi:hypothetical protein
MGYENSAACKMLATHCCACGKSLVDAVSVEAGMGPDCRKKYLNNVEVDAAVRGEANAIVYRIAVLQAGEEVLGLTNVLREMGFAVLANRIGERLASITIEEDGEVIAVYTPYDPNLVAAMRAVPGRRWVKEKKVNAFPLTSKRAVWALLKKFFPGKIATGPKGLFTITA